MQNESDALFTKIMNKSIMDSKRSDIPLPDDITCALNENEESIVAFVDMCPSDESFWYHITKKSGNWDCQYLTGEPCHCT